MTSTSAYIPTMCRLMTVKTSACAWWWPDDDVPREIHHAGHDGETRDRRDHRRRNAGPAQDLPERSRRGRLGRAARLVRLLQLERDRPRIGTDVEGDDQPDERHGGCDEPGDDERVQLEVLPGEERTKDERAERCAEERAEQHVGDRSRLLLRRVHVRRGRPGEEDAAAHRPDADEAENHERRAVGETAESRECAADRSDHEAAGDDRNAAEAIHQTPGGKGGERASGEEDRRPEAEDRLDARDEHQRDGRDGDRELDDAGEQSQAEGEKDGVPPDLRLARHCGRAYRAGSCPRALRWSGPVV